MNLRLTAAMIAICGALVTSNVYAQDMVHSPQKNMPGPVPAGVPEVVKLTGAAMAEINDKLVENYGVPEAIYMSYDPLTQMILVNTKNGPTVFTNRSVDFIFGASQGGGIGLFSNHKGSLENRKEAMNRPFAIEQMARLNDPVVYQARNEQYRVAVFVEPTCGYCYKLHTEMQEYMDLGITFEYHPFPIYGEFSEVTMERLWSLPEAERAEAVTEIKDYVNTHRNELQGKSPESILSRFNLPEASNKAKAYVRLSKGVGQDLGIAGTPALVLENGRVLGGYLPAAELKRILDGEK